MPNNAMTVSFTEPSRCETFVSGMAGFGSGLQHHLMITLTQLWWCGHVSTVTKQFVDAVVSVGVAAVGVLKVLVVDSWPLQMS